PRIEQPAVRGRLAAARVEAIAPAPAAAAHKVAPALQHEIGPVRDELWIGLGDEAHRARRLTLVVVARKQRAHRLLHQCLDRGPVARERRPKWRYTPDRSMHTPLTSPGQGRTPTTTSYAVLAVLALRDHSTYDLTKHGRFPLRYLWPRAERPVYAEPTRLVA